MIHSHTQTTYPDRNASDLWDNGNAGALRVLNELLQVLHLLAKFLCQRKALAHLHEQGCYLVAAQESCRPPLQAVQDTGFHSSCNKAKSSPKRQENSELTSQQAASCRIRDLTPQQKHFPRGNQCHVLLPPKQRGAQGTQMSFDPKEQAVPWLSCLQSRQFG